MFAVDLARCALRLGSARTLDDGTQVWAQTRNGDIVNGGLNQTPRPFNPQSGLSRQQPPRRR